MASEREIANELRSLLNEYIGQPNTPGFRAEMNATIKNYFYGRGWQVPEDIQLTFDENGGVHLSLPDRIEINPLRRELSPLFRGGDFLSGSNKRIAELEKKIEELENRNYELGQEVEYYQMLAGEN